VAKITIFRPDGPQSYDKIDVTSFENGVVMFTIPGKANQFESQAFTTNLPFIIEGRKE